MEPSFPDSPRAGALKKQDICHCERSEAIYLCKKKRVRDCFVGSYESYDLRPPRNDFFNKPFRGNDNYLGYFKYSNFMVLKLRDVFALAK